MGASVPLWVFQSPLIGLGEAEEMEGRTFLLDESEVVGEVVTTKAGAKPVLVSVGHMVSLETAVTVVRGCSKSRISQPLLALHKLATKTRLDLV